MWISFQLSVSSCQLPVASFQLPVVSCQLPVASCLYFGIMISEPLARRSHFGMSLALKGRQTLGRGVNPFAENATIHLSPEGATLLVES